MVGHEGLVMLTPYCHTYSEVFLFSLTSSSPQDVCLIAGSDLPLDLNNVREQARIKEKCMICVSGSALDYFMDARGLFAFSMVANGWT